MNIRRAISSDEAVLAKIRREAILAIAVSAMSQEAVVSWATQVASDRFTRAIQEHDTWVAEQEGNAIGWVEVNRDRLASLYVSPSFASRGVGSNLLACAERLVHTAGYKVVRLEASPNALSFYVKRGYICYGPQRRDGAWPMNKELNLVR